MRVSALEWIRIVAAGQLSSLVAQGTTFLLLSANDSSKETAKIHARRSTSRLSGLPTVQGGITRLAVDRLRQAGIKLQPLLSGVGLTVDQVDEPERRLSASKQIAFLEAAAEALNDDLLGFRLAEQFDLRDLGLLYYVMATADTLGDALKRASRYSRLTNEAIVFEYREGREPVLRLAYAGIPRHADRSSRWNSA